MQNKLINMLARYDFLRQLIERPREGKTQVTFFLIPVIAAKLARLIAQNREEWLKLL